MIRTQNTELDVPIYESKHYKYIRISDLSQGYVKLELAVWVKGKLQPLIQGEEGAIIDAVFYDDYLEFLEYLKGKQAKIN